MSLYYEAASLITTLGSSQDSSLKSLLFSKTSAKGEQPRKSNPSQLYALITESWKWSSVLKEIIEKSSLLQLERKLSPQLALVLVHDLLFAKKGIAAPENHVLRKAVEKHKARLKAEFTKARIRHGCASAEELKSKLERESSIKATESAYTNVDGNGADSRHEIKKYPHPRWLRINTLRITTEILMKDGLETWTRVESLDDVLFSQSSSSSGSTIYYVDEHVPNLLALPPGTDLSLISAYRKGELISQDKASCFPAYLLSSGKAFAGPVLDACAAPGNKTSHITAIASEQASLQLNLQAPRVYATERDSRRADVLQKMLKIAGAEQVKVEAGQDFFKLDPSSRPWSDISSIILDPSCSGSGIVDRGQTMIFDLPSMTPANHNTNGNLKVSKKSKKSKKRKRTQSQPLSAAKVEESTEMVVEENDNVMETGEPNSDKHNDLQGRLKALAALQIKMLIFAFSFPKVQRITYSTCSIHNLENENVVIAALASDIAKSCGWRILKRSEQVEGLKMWDSRGRHEACHEASITHDFSTAGEVESIADACIRCEPFTKDGTQGFFVAGFVRDQDSQNNADDQSSNAKSCESDEEAGEWGGFDD